MTYDLYIGDQAFSSWSMRGWLMLEKFNIPFQAHMVGLYSGTMAQDLEALAPARLVPALHTPDGLTVGETFAMAETLNERHPEANLWPQDPKQRATARWLCAEMTSGFMALRAACPMQLLRVYKGFEVSDAVKTDLARIETLWTHAREMSGATTGNLFGNYSLADVFYTPVAARIIGYDLPVSAENRAYALHLLSDPTVQKWRADGLQKHYDPEPYKLDLPSTDWPI